ncbi:AbrB/MazE/SpoVT family DNA-binding domain-containing protein [Pseudomonas sp. GD03860]|uniref:AbrB/MazE/SpoVT family DNA-binding domain-containing protein n=1 Tax=Pseudomonas sp. GD03860 TaxID=2975389 RepID=UPI0023637782|nr:MULTISPECIES: AbrB/MazE/SpoVT family DNA-binding domain-containing protein [Pseudomonas]MDD2058443.1 AbrB/MazE/SpoVT family DNA-binding domain-containing protein [Pseudomonas putida]MDH0640875.1 AbrB/MazE/SpoVT family DNA-binding domain-containing protein [Pseudomonas sp. GD03860]
MAERDGNTHRIEPERMTVICQDSGDSSGDVIIDLPPEVLAGLNVKLGDSLSIELVEGAIVLKPIRNAAQEILRQPSTRKVDGSPKPGR